MQTLGQRIKDCLGVDFGLLGSFREGFDQFFFVRMRVSIGLDFIGICQMATMFCWGDVTENESNATASKQSLVFDNAFNFPYFIALNLMPL